MHADPTRPEAAAPPPDLAPPTTAAIVDAARLLISDAADALGRDLVALLHLPTNQRLEDGDDPDQGNADLVAQSLDELLEAWAERMIRGVRERGFGLIEAIAEADEAVETGLGCTLDVSRAISMGAAIARLGRAAGGDVLVAEAHTIEAIVYAHRRADFAEVLRLAPAAGAPA